VSLEIQVDNRFIVVCCDFTSSTLGCRRRSNPRSSLRLNIPWSTHQPLSSPIPVDLGRGPSRHVVVCYSSCFEHQDTYCFVCLAKSLHRQLFRSASQGMRTKTKCGTLCFLFCCESAKQLVFQLYQERTHVCTVSFLFCFCLSATQLARQVHQERTQVV